MLHQTVEVRNAGTLGGWELGRLISTGICRLTEPDPVPMGVVFPSVLSVSCDAADTCYTFIVTHGVFVDGFGVFADACRVASALGNICCSKLAATSEDGMAAQLGVDIPFL